MYLFHLLNITRIYTLSWFFLFFRSNDHMHVHWIFTFGNTLPVCQTVAAFFKTIFILKQCSWLHICTDSYYQFYIFSLKSKAIGKMSAVLAHISAITVVGVLLFGFCITKRFCDCSHISWTCLFNNIAALPELNWLKSQHSLTLVKFFSPAENSVLPDSSRSLICEWWEFMPYLCG